MVLGDGKVPYSAGSRFFLLIITRSGRLAEIRWPVCILKSQKFLCISFSRTDSGLCIYHLFVWSNVNFLHNSHWITFHTQLCLFVIIIIIIIHLFIYIFIHFYLFIWYYLSAQCLSNDSHGVEPVPKTPAAVCRLEDIENSSKTSGSVDNVKPLIEMFL